MKYLGPVLFALMAGAASASAAQTPVQSWTLTRAQWAGVQGAGGVVALAPVRAAVAALGTAPDARIAVIHNGGEDAVFWASDLEGWLVALGVPSTRIDDRTAAVSPAELRLRVEPAGAGSP